jgi:RNA polymerase sigma-70 factor, ECF subfamily
MEIHLCKAGEVPSGRDWSEEIGGLRRFGRALVRDARFAPDDASAARLVDKLIRQAHVTAIGSRLASRQSARLAAYTRFVQLHRRHIRRIALDENDVGWSEAATQRCGQAVVNGVRALPLEQREALLLVALAGFSHREAAEALDISLAQLIERLDRGRERLAESMSASADMASPASWIGAPHLRVIK